MTTATQTTGLVGYHSEMGEQRPADATIDSQISHDGKHYFLKTRLTLKGRGVKFLKTLTSQDLTPYAQDKVGCHTYKVTDAAFDRICREHKVASEMLL